MTLLARIVLLLLLTALQAFGQRSLEFDGQFSAFGNFSPDNELDVQLGARYIPELEYGIPFDSTSNLDFQVSANLDANSAFSPFYKSKEDGHIDPYRIWSRYSTMQIRC